MASRQRKRKVETKLVVILQREMYEEQRPKLEYLCQQAREDLRKAGWEISLIFSYNGEENTVNFLAAKPESNTFSTEWKEIGAIPLKEFQILSPGQHERMIQILKVKTREALLG